MNKTTLDFDIEKRGKIRFEYIKLFYEKFSVKIIFFKNIHKSFNKLKIMVSFKNSCVQLKIISQ